MTELKDIGALSLSPDERYIVFGAGKAGKMISGYLRNHGVDQVVMSDRNPEYHDLNAAVPIMSFHDALKQGPANILVGFLDNPEEKLQSAQESGRRYQPVSADAPGGPSEERGDEQLLGGPQVCDR